MQRTRQRLTSILVKASSLVAILTLITITASCFLNAYIPATSSRGLLQHPQHAAAIASEFLLGNVHFPANASASHGVIAKLDPLSNSNVTLDACPRGDDVSEVVRKLRLRHLHFHGGKTSRMFVDPKQTRFAWAPRLLCARNNFLITSYMGRPMCKCELERFPELSHQLDRIFADLQSVGIKHNDLAKDLVTEVVLRDGLVSLVDFGRASVNGSLTVQCLVDGKNASAPDNGPRKRILDKGFRRIESAWAIGSQLRTCWSPWHIHYCYKERPG